MHLTKHHGLGNDFLVLLDPDGVTPIDADTAIAVCDRHRGVGADGLIRVTRGTTSPFRFELRNEDGSSAEMSGNGISCMAQALVRAGYVPGGSLDVDTDAGPRTIEVVETFSDHEHRMRVAMGDAVLGAAVHPDEDGSIGQAMSVDVGNPHIVCHVPDPAAAPDLAVLGARLNHEIPGGANVEYIAVADDGVILMTVYERGVGLTQACGTGAVAAATVANAMGLIGDRATVRQPGGDAMVEVGSPAHLTVPVVAIAEIDWTGAR